jgi:hypothetical protein
LTKFLLERGTMTALGQRRHRGLSFDHLVGAAAIDFPDQLSEQFCSDAPQAACLRPKDSIALASPGSECQRGVRRYPHPPCN